MNITQLTLIIIITLFLNYLWGNYIKPHAKTLNTETQDINISTDNTKQQSRKIIKYFFLIIAFFPLLGGLWAMNYWLSDYNTAKDSVNWKEYDGKIIDKSIDQCSSAGTTGHQLAGRTYRPSIKYQFIYNEKVITWDKISFLNTPCSGDQKKSQRILDSFPDIGDKVKVYFSSEKKQAVLKTGTKNSSYFGLFGGIFFFLLGLLGLRLIYQ